MRTVWIVVITVAVMVAVVWVYGSGIKKGIEAGIATDTGTE